MAADGPRGEKPRPVRVLGNGQKITKSRFARMTQTENHGRTEDAAVVRLSDLTRELGIDNARRKLTEQDLIKPVEPVRQGRPTYVSADDAERVKRAVIIAARTGVPINIVLKVLSEP
jgi:hypothetical protein